MAKILIIDDSEAARQQLKTNLEKAGYEVVEASSGVDALAAVAINLDLKLIITDLNMPRMDGYTFCLSLTEALEREGRSKIPVFVLTSDPGPNAKAKAKKLAITAFILKPFVVDKLISAVQKIVG